MITEANAQKLAAGNPYLAYCFITKICRMLSQRLRHESFALAALALEGEEEGVSKEGGKETHVRGVKKLARGHIELLRWCPHILPTRLLLPLRALSLVTAPRGVASPSSFL